MNKKVMIGGIIAIAAISLIAVNILKSTGAASVFGGGGGYPVKVAEIQKGEISAYISANGVIEEVEKSEVFFDAPFKVSRVLVAEGDKVAKGQKILELDTGSLVSELEKLKTNKGIQALSLNSKVADAEVNRAQSAVNNALRTYNDSKRAYADNKELYDSNSISKKELDISENACIQAESALNDARAAYKVAVESRSLNKSTAEENMKVMDITINDLEDRIARTAESQLSPMDGVVAALNVDTGGFTSNMQPAYKVINPDKLQVKAKIKEYDIKNVSVGQNVRITGDAIDKEKNISGRVTAISPVATVSRTTSGDETVIEVTIAIDNPEGALKPGLNVTCDVYTVDKKGVIVAPLEMITEDKDGNKLVFVVDMKSKTMKETMVKLGINSDMTVEVTEGLKEGDVVIIEPQPMYRDGAKVRILEDTVD
ncbi:MAG: efflux RND transporter periplasmic adaptor subunit [Ruminiclostridium sp.]|nr:efflux RND transporter periplasmic adaptor subunit [Ruminiclostridium sp.]